MSGFTGPINTLPAAQAPQPTDIIPIWQSSGVAPFTRGAQVAPIISAGFALALTGGPVPSTFIGSGTTADFWRSVVMQAASETVPEIVAQYSIASNVGSGAKQTAYKIALTASAVSGPNSADTYGINTIVQGYGGTYLVTGIESDVNNIGTTASTIAGTASVYGLVSVCAGTAPGTAGLWVIATSGGGWTYGTVVSEATIASYFDGSVAPIGLAIHGSHTTGIDMLAGFPITIGMALPNSCPIQALDAGGTLRNLIQYDSSSHLILGDTNAGAIVALNTLEPFGDNAWSLGVSGARWTSVWSANGTIQTSQRELKTDITPLPSMIDVVSALKPVTYKWISGGKVPVQSTEQKLMPVMVEETYTDFEIQVVDGKAVRTEVEKTRMTEVVDRYPIFDGAGKPVMHPGKKVKHEDGTVTVQPPTQHMHSVRRMAMQDVPKVTYEDRPGSRTHWGFIADDVKSAFEALGTDFGGYIKADDGVEGIRSDQLIPVLCKAVQELIAEVAALKVAK